MLKLIVIAGMVLAVIAVLINQKFAKQANAKTANLKTIRAKKLLTRHEQHCYYALTAALPEHIVLAQVALSAIITATNTATRNRFDRKVADFVICDKAFQVIAVIELDDPSHKGKEQRDKARDTMVAAAGYKTIRYNQLPSAETIKADICSPATLEPENDKPATQLQKI